MASYRTWNHRISKHFRVVHPAWTKDSEAWHFRALQSRFPSNEPHRDTARTRGQDPGVQTGPFLARRVPAHGRGVRQYVGRHHTRRSRRPVQAHPRRDRAAGSGRTRGDSDQRLDQAAAAAGPGDSELPKHAGAGGSGLPEPCPASLHRSGGARGRHLRSGGLHQPPGRCGAHCRNAALRQRTDEVGLGPHLIAGIVENQRYRAAVAASTDDATASGVFGVPSFLFDGKLFFGSDRMHLLDATLAAGPVDDPRKRAFPTRCVRRDLVPDRVP